MFQTQWSAFYAPGPEILAYLQGIVDKYKLMRYIKLRHELIHARYDEAEGKWHLRIRRPVPGMEHGKGDETQYEVIEDTADFVHAGTGTLSRWNWPDIEGLKDFRGTLLHPAEWDSGELPTRQESIKSWTDKRIGIIGVVRAFRLF